MQRPDDGVDKLRWAPTCDLSGEVDHDDVVDACSAEQLLAPLQGGEQQRHLIGPDDRHRVRPEGHRDQRGTGLGSLGNPEQLRVSPMHSVKVADDDDRICLHGGQLTTATTEHGLSYRAAARARTVEREQCPLRAEQRGRVGRKIKLRQLATVANLDHLQRDPL